MQAVIMAGGQGTRLREITHDVIPKPMVEVNGKPLLERQIDCLKENDVDNIIIVTGHLGEVIRNYFGNGSNFGIRISYYEENEPLGTAGALAMIRGRLDSNFYLVFGDVLFDVDLARMWEAHIRSKAEATLFVHPNAHPFDSDLVVTDDKGYVVRFDSKHNVRNYWYRNVVNAGIYVLNRSLCDRIQSGVKVDLEKQILSPLCEVSRAVYTYQSPEYVKDVGTVERIIAASEEMRNGVISAKNLKKKQKAIFLDRDGTVNVKNGLVYSEDQFTLEPTAAEAIAKINASGYLAIIISNQPVVARGLCNIDDLEDIHKKMETLLGQKNAYLDDIFYCPHHPDKGYPEENPAFKIPCSCRKPDIGLIQTAVGKYNIDLSESWFIGDTTVDIQTGINAGVRTILVQTGDAGKDRKFQVKPNFVKENILDAVNCIMEVE